MSAQNQNKAFFWGKKLKNYFAAKPVKKAYIFGSYSRNEQTEESDIDILVELDYDKGADFFLFVEMQEELSRILAKKVDLVSANGLSKYIKPYIEADKKLIYDYAAL
ncbi:MAG: nucleotidyltransferase family protein [Spirosomataceae bacterium]